MAIAGAEAQRQAEPDAEKRKYPGGAFDPLGLSKDSKVRPPSRRHLQTASCRQVRDRSLERSTRHLTHLKGVTGFSHACAQRLCDV